MCNATVALEVLARACGLSGEVIVPGFTFIATAHAFAWLGLKPVFCDVDPATHTLDAADVAGQISGATSAVVGVHLWGNTCDVSALQTAAKGKPLLFDSAHALGCSRNGQSIGGFGNAEVFSFHATKFFNTFEGGAITTNDAALAKELRLLRNFGFAGYDAVATLGTNAKLNEISAAMGLSSLDCINQTIESNRQTFSHYHGVLDALEGVRFVQPAPNERSNFQYVVCEIGGDAPLNRDQLLTLLWAENVRARRYFFPGCHRVPPYEHAQTRALPVTERLAAEVIVLPAGAAVTQADVQRIGGFIRFAFEHADELRAQLPEYVPPGGFKA
ncbi:MAG TPA: DegT/DnrJ/EryC1/StrS family aminotransferase, partial [Longimicrobiales bacterium]|nr:DegT/DnrJ/EryC1/StrS family aminotransferase [Longimicrobiales bacterium]